LTHEDGYLALAKHMFVSDESIQRDKALPQAVFSKPIKFESTNKAFVSGYFKFLINPIEDRDGIDFWWIDWQQGTTSALAGVDPMFVLNHYHWYDMLSRGKRPLILSRWPGLGGQRYPLGFSGDTAVTWDMLGFQVHMTATSSNVGFTWWSHDIGGFHQGKENPDLFLRWVQFGVFSPIFRLRSIKNEYINRRPWAFSDATTTMLVGLAMRLRHALVPYIYSHAWHTTFTGSSDSKPEFQPLIRPLYYVYPHHNQSYAFTSQYFFGSELLVSPFISPMNSDLRLSRTAVWFPPNSTKLKQNGSSGREKKEANRQGWFDFFTGEYFEPDTVEAVYGGPEKIPVFAKAGAIVVLGPGANFPTSPNFTEPLSPGFEFLEMSKTKLSVEVPSQLFVHIFTGADGSFDLFEDDGISLDYLNGKYSITRFTLNNSVESNRIVFTIHPSEGCTNILPQQRTYNLYFIGVNNRQKIMVRLNNQGVRSVSSSYNVEREALQIFNLTLSPQDRLTITMTAPLTTLLSNRDRSLEKLKYFLKTIPLVTAGKQILARYIDSISKLQAELPPGKPVSRQTKEPIACKVLTNFQQFFTSFKTASSGLKVLGVRSQEELVTATHLRAISELLLRGGVHLVNNSMEGIQTLVQFNNRVTNNLKYGFSKTDRSGGSGFQPKVIPRIRFLNLYDDKPFSIAITLCGVFKFTLTDKELQ